MYKKQEVQLYKLENKVLNHEKESRVNLIHNYSGHKPRKFSINWKQLAA